MAIPLIPNMNWSRYIYCILFLFLSLNANAQNEHEPYILVLGIAQDGGYPHIGCQHKCCNMAWENDSLKKWVVSLALVDPVNKKWWLFEVTPDIKEQLHYFQSLTRGQYNFLPDGVFVTHAHIGHYTGLMEFGKEAMSTKEVPVYSLPRMAAFLETNGPWSQLVKLNNITLHPMHPDTSVQLTEQIRVTAFTVPHRDEYSETAGFRINTGNKKYLFIPDINKWDVWDRSIVTEVKAVDVALIDATFYDSTELPGRNLKSVPHPFVIATMNLFEKEDALTKSKIHFIHFNHTNPLLWGAKKRAEVKKAGYNIAIQGGKL
jgi:pyrroloquinoline quinone biosynthesis protein B